jgi:hypothetical protein
VSKKELKMIEVCGELKNREKLEIKKKKDTQKYFHEEVK